MWQKLKAWRTEASAKRNLSVGEVFYRLNGWQRALLVLLCALTVYKFMAPMLVLNVIPHYLHIFNADGSINATEWQLAENQSAGIIGILIGGALLALRQVTLFQRALIIAGIAAAFFMNAQNGIISQSGGHESRVMDTESRNKEVTRLRSERDTNDTAYKNVRPHDYMTKAMLEVKKREASDAYTKSINACPRTRRHGIKSKVCLEAEAASTAASSAYNKAVIDEQLTEQAETYQGAFKKASQELSKLGDATIARTDELSLFQEFLIEVVGVSETRAKALAKFKPVTDTLGSELFAAAFTVPACYGWFILFGLFTCRTGEAQERVNEVMKAVAADHVKKAAELPEVALHPMPKAQIDAALSEMKPDHSEESVLGIEGEELPAFVENPRGKFETVAAAALKADPDKTFERKARCKQPDHKDSVRLFIKECTVPRDGRFEWAGKVIDNYVAWCKERNLTPVHPVTFGRMMNSAEFPHISPERLSGGQSKYWGIGLRNSFRVVA
jgi:hypothetical protein